MSGSKVEVLCKNCKEPFMARVADRKRGWAKFCSKSCKAKKQSKSSGGKKYSLNTIVSAFREGRVSEEYFVYIVNKYYPDSQRRVLAETGIDVYEEQYNDHPHSCEALGQWV